ncbi:DnaB-like helicase N-terminal domain-containing protein [Singulisphaera sp. Ch08]|uniref:DnaB-like helicase N-terminal domain-containing protein n=1 Tax=Singulisphaera sp. Ch08 TaxID=3120278 RepID=A0AAU7CN09_9BACT
MGSTNGRGQGDYRPPLRHFDPDSLPSHNVEAEQGVLGAILLDNKVLEIEEVARLTINDFFRSSHQVIFTAIRRLEKEGSPIDGISLGHELKRDGVFDEVDGDQGISELYESVPHALHAKKHADILREMTISRMHEERARDDAQDARSNSFTSEELLRRSAECAARIEAVSRAEEIQFEQRPWPDEPDPAIWHGLAGEIVQMISPHTEADSMAILAQLLVCFGSIVGRKLHWMVEASRHGCNLFVAIVGNSSKARKGTSYDQVRNLFAECQPEWDETCIKRGLVSGEGMIHEVRDPIFKRQKSLMPLLGANPYEEVEIDPGIDDKRALFVESEIGSTLSALSRDGNTLSGYVRQAWDGQTLRAATKNSPTKSTGAHISIIGHVTTEELHRRLSHNDAANGFANRFLWICARRSKYLSRGGNISSVDFTSVHRRLKQAIDFATDDFLGTGHGRKIHFDRAGGKLWDEVYPNLSEPQAGLLGSVTSRAETQTMRLACNYALLDESPTIGVVHLRAAIALWRYCEQSAAYIFGESMGNANAEKLLTALEAAGEAGLSQTTIVRKVFGGGDKAGKHAEAACRLLAKGGVAELVEVSTGGRKAKVWILTRGSGGVVKTVIRDAESA